MASIFPEAMSPGGRVTGLGDSLRARTNGGALLFPGAHLPGEW